MISTCKKICGECPFRKDSAPGWLGPHTVEEILHMQQMEGLFTCHMQRGGDDDDEITLEDILEGHIDICRGFLASASASAKLFGQHPIYGPALNFLQRQITDEDREQVLKRWDFFEHHTLEEDEAAQ